MYAKNMTDGQRANFAYFITFKTRCMHRIMRYFLQTYRIKQAVSNRPTLYWKLHVTLHI